MGASGGSFGASDLELGFGLTALEVCTPGVERGGYQQLPPLGLAAALDEARGRRMFSWVFGLNGLMRKFIGERWSECRC